MNAYCIKYPLFSYLKPPKPMKSWLGELQATTPGHECLQYKHIPSRMSGDHVTGSEDCLYLNIYRPDLKESKDLLLPVVFKIHGGAFMMGSGTMYGPKYVMDKKVVYVTVNYRLGPLGMSLVCNCREPFLCLKIFKTIKKKSILFKNPKKIIYEIMIGKNCTPRFFSNTL